ncbi:uncharacterized protein RCO7_02434 [Rhynchosporium graminicola]|uniref:DUF8212 domain-containing protein n=1 Tax=Rhynchosporium graminicola TaxID=2792576 RepID=A0A1E1JV72_9HELO|nr:uncharacterized protein RCO7_02434 [Rhynchosporium commune]
MSLIYGEGNKAFTRLQEEILEETDDQSLFAWKYVFSNRPNPLNYWEEFTSVLAESPNNFERTAGVVPFPSGPSKSPCMMTSRGLRRINVRPLPFPERSGMFMAVLDCHWAIDLSCVCAIVIEPINDGNTHQRSSSFELITRVPVDDVPEQHESISHDNCHREDPSVGHVGAPETRWPSQPAGNILPQDIYIVKSPTIFYTNSLFVVEFSHLAQSGFEIVGKVPKEDLWHLNKNTLQVSLARQMTDGSIAVMLFNFKANLGFKVVYDRSKPRFQVFPRAKKASVHRHYNMAEIVLKPMELELE